MELYLHRLRRFNHIMPFSAIIRQQHFHFRVHKFDWICTIFSNRFPKIVIFTLKITMHEYPFPLDDAKAENIWMFVRHGTRRPKVEKITELKELEEVMWFKNYSQYIYLFAYCLPLNCSCVMKSLKTLRIKSIYRFVNVIGSDWSNGSGTMASPMIKHKCWLPR